jgi:hypothetical protein
MKYCAVLLLLCIMVVTPITAADYIANCSAGLVNDEGAVVRISTVPDGARVTIDNNPLGATPFQQNLGLVGYQYGTHTLVLTAPGYETVTMNFLLCYPYLTDIRKDLKPVTPAPTHTPVVTATTRRSGQPASSATPDNDGLPTPTGTPEGTSPPAGSGGSLSVTTQPAGAEVYIDGSIQGITPVILHELPPGTHTLVLKLPGYRDETVPLTITAGETLAYSTRLAGTTAAGTASQAGTTPAPGFAGVLAFIALGAVLLSRRQ